jgi:hypothetical protein
MQWLRSARRLWNFFGRAGHLPLVVPTLSLLAGCADDRPPSPTSDNTSVENVVTDPPDTTSSGSDGGVAGHAGADGSVADAAAHDASTADGGSPALPDRPVSVPADSERLVVTDARAKKVYVVDSATFATVLELDAEAGSHVVAGPSALYAYVWSSLGGLKVLDGGFRTQAPRAGRGEVVLSLAAPAWLALSTEGLGPRALTVSSNTLAVSFSQEPRAAFFTEDDLPAAIAATDVNTGVVHDGVALSVGNLRVVSQGHDEPSPSTLRVAGANLDIPGCTNPNLAASAPNVGAVACAEGLAYLSQSSTGRLLSRVEPLAEGAVSQLRGARDAPIFAAITGDGHDVVLLGGASAGTAHFETRVVALAFATSGKQLLALLATGELASVSTTSMAESSTRIATGCVSADDALRPDLVHGVHVTYLTCPSQGEVRELAAGTFELGPVHKLGVAPSELVSLTF